METTARRYSTPVSPPRLIVRAGGESTASVTPVLCLRCGGGAGHAVPRLVSFDWGRVALSNLRR